MGTEPVWKVVESNLGSEDEFSSELERRPVEGGWLYRQWSWGLGHARIVSICFVPIDRDG